MTKKKKNQLLNNEGILRKQQCAWKNIILCKKRFFDEFERCCGFSFDEITNFPKFVQFMYRPTDPASLGVVRALFGICMVLDVVEERGLADIDLKWGDSYSCHFPLIHGMNPPSLPWMILLFTLMWIGAFGIMLGFCFKLACAAFVIPYWYILLLDKSFWNNHSYLYGIVALLFWGTDANRYFAIDAQLLQKSTKDKSNEEKIAQIPLWNYFIIKFQFFTLYFLAGLKKFSREWLEGYSMTNLSHHWVFDPFKIFLTTEQTDFFIVHWCGFIFDLTVGFFMLFNKTRIPAMLFCAAFHFMNSKLFSIGMFPYVCLATMPLFCHADWPRNVSKQCRLFIDSIKYYLYHYLKQINQIKCASRHSLCNFKDKNEQNKEIKINPANNCDKIDKDHLKMETILKKDYKNEYNGFKIINLTNNCDKLDKDGLTIAKYIKNNNKRKYSELKATNYTDNDNKINETDVKVIKSVEYNIRNEYNELEVTDFAKTCDKLKKDNLKIAKIVRNDIKEEYNYFKAINSTKNDNESNKIDLNTGNPLKCDDKNGYNSFELTNYTKFNNKIDKNKIKVAKFNKNNATKVYNNFEVTKFEENDKEKTTNPTKKQKLIISLLLIHIVLQMFLPYSHFITKGYNNWVPGLYGYSWDMMIHSWDTILIVVRVHDNLNNEDHFIDPQAWVQNDKWSKHGDMVIQYAQCLKDNLLRRKAAVLNSQARPEEIKEWLKLSSNLSIYIDVRCSLNGRFQQRVFNPNADMLHVNWHPLKTVSFLMPLLTQFSSYRYKMDEITRAVYSWSNYTDVLYIADYPGMQLDNYFSDDFSNVSLTVIKGEVSYVEEDWEEKLTVDKDHSVSVTTGKLHQITTTSSYPSCYMYTYTNQTREKLEISGRLQPAKRRSGIPIIKELKYRVNAWWCALGHIANAFFYLVYKVPMIRRVPRALNYYEDY